MSLRWTEKKIAQVATIHITSAAALVDALLEMDCTIITALPANNAARLAQKNYEQALNRMSEINPLSLKDATLFEEAVNAAIEASNDLKMKLESATKEKPDSIQVKDKNGVKRTLNRKAGAYLLEWTDIKRSNNYGNATWQRDTASKSFSETLLKTNDSSQRKRAERQKQILSELSSKNQVLSERFQKAVGIREQWERIEAHGRLQDFRQERASAIEERGKSMGFSCKRVVDNKEEIVISLRRRN